MPTVVLFATKYGANEAARVSGTAHFVFAFRADSAYIQYLICQVAQLVWDALDVIPQD